MWGTRLVTDLISGRMFRMTTPNAEKDRHMNYNEALSRAARESGFSKATIDDLVKSKRGQSTREMADAKDYMESDIDEFDRRAEGQRRSDMRESSRYWRGIQALDDDELFALGAELAEESRAMLVSGRPSRIRFPGARGDSELRPIQDQRYVEPMGDEDEVSLGEGQGEGRSRIGGDRIARRVMRPGMDSDAYTRGKSLGFRGRGFTPMDLLKSRNAIKSQLHKAMMDERLDPNVLLNFDAAFTEQRLGFDVSSAMRALACIDPSVRKAYGIPTVANNYWEELGRARRAV